MEKRYQKKTNLRIGIIFIFSGPHRAETAKIDMDTTSGITQFQENLRINATLYYEEKTGKFLEKKVNKNSNLGG